MTNQFLKIPKSHQEAIRRCVALDRMHRTRGLGSDTAQYLPTAAQTMALLWDAEAQLAAASLSDMQNTSTDIDAPGYVFINQDKTKYAIPFYLIDVFPLGDLLSEINQLVEYIRIGNDSMICLSGSGCWLGSNVPVGDLDFCEYVNGFKDSLAERLIGIAKNERNDLVCMNVTLSPKIRWKRPWTMEVQKPTQAFLDRTKRTLSRSKHKMIDYLAITKNLGVLEVTNKVLVLDFARAEGGEARSSFSLQEVPFGKTSWVPRDLSDPLEIGRYVSWLMSEVEKRLKESKETPRSAVKALRRALPLARILKASNETKKLGQLLLDENGPRLAAIHDRCVLYKTLDAQDTESFQVYKTNLKKSILGLRNQTEEQCAQYDSLTQDEDDALNAYAIFVRRELPEIVSKLDVLLSFS